MTINYYYNGIRENLYYCDFISFGKRDVKNNFYYSFVRRRRSSIEFKYNYKLINDDCPIMGRIITHFGTNSEDGTWYREFPVSRRLMWKITREW